MVRKYHNHKLQTQLKHDSCKVTSILKSNVNSFYDNHDCLKRLHDSILNVYKNMCTINNLRNTIENNTNENVQPQDSTNCETCASCSFYFCIFSAIEF